MTRRRPIFVCDVVVCPECEPERKTGYRALCEEHERKMALELGLCTGCISEPEHCVCETMTHTVRLADFYGPVGTPIYAPADGVVKRP